MEEEKEIEDDFFNEFPEIEPEKPEDPKIWLPEQEIYTGPVEVRYTGAED